MERFRDFLRFLNFPMKYDIRGKFAGAGIFIKKTCLIICSAYHWRLIPQKCSSTLPKTGKISWSECLDYLNGLYGFPLGLLLEISCYLLSNIQDSFVLWEEMWDGITTSSRIFTVKVCSSYFAMTLPHLRAKDVLGKTLISYFPKLHWQAVIQNMNHVWFRFVNLFSLIAEKKNAAF